MSRRTTRREFLTGASAAQAMADAAAGVGDAPGPPPAARSYLFHVERRAMACRFAVYLNPDGASFAEAALNGLALVAELEEQLSVFREHSEVSRLNRRAFQEHVEVEAGLFGLLSRAVELHRETGGAFDMTSGPLTKAWGFYRRQGRLPDPGEIVAALAQVGSQWIELDAIRQTIHFSRPGVEINLGAIGKGYALDRCAEFLESEGVGDFLLHGGQSSVLARGRQKTTLAPTKGWTIGVKHPVWPKRRLAEIDLQNKALGTSGAENQYFYHQGKRYGHILDPRTGWPASGVLTASVIAADAATADALSTAFYVMGVDAARDYCERHEDVSAVMVTPGERSGAVVLHAIGVDEGELRFVE
jgi:thiamine biosynthesis lipoprotein